MLTSLSRDHVADVLTKLIEPFGEVRPEDHWKPEGFLGPAEAKLGEDLDFLPTESRQILTRWWLKASRAANTPNWDLVSTFTVGDRRGLVLVEAKAHEAELRPEGDFRCFHVESFCSSLLQRFSLKISNLFYQ